MSFRQACIAKKFAARSGRQSTAVPGRATPCRNSLGYPKAALFGFCAALAAYTILSTIKAALSSEYGAETVETQVSGYYLADEIQLTYRGMLNAVEDDEWNVFWDLDID